MINSLNLALSNQCSANCIFCPSDRGRRHPFLMQMPVVDKLLQEVIEDGFPWEVRHVEVGENGDALLNPLFLDILRKIRLRLPLATVNLTTNLFMATKGVTALMLGERLVDSLQLNVDGHDAPSYEAQKRIPYSRVMENLRTLVDLRDRMWPEFPVSITVLPLAEYVSVVKRAFGREPIKLPDGPVVSSSFRQVQESLGWLPSNISLRHSPIFGWAERSQPYQGSQNYPCPQLSRVETEAFINPEGLWYPCCLDANQDQAYGSVMEHTLVELHDSPQRLNFIRHLKEGKMMEMGYPCNRPAFCRVLSCP